MPEKALEMSIKFGAFPEVSYQLSHIETIKTLPPLVE